MRDPDVMARGASPGRLRVQRLVKAVVVVAVVVLVVWALPWWLTRAPHLEGAERHKAMSDVRTGLFAALGALGAVGGLAYTAKTVRLSQIAQLNDRFQSASRQMGDPHPTVRLAGLHAMAHLADDWAEQRQRCVDVLCAYLRTSRGPADDSGGGGDGHERDEDQAVRRMVIDLLGARLRPGTGAGWRGCVFDLTGATLDVGNFAGVSFGAGRFVFEEVRFTGRVRFDEARFAGADVVFTGARFERGCHVSFIGAEFSAGEVSFDHASFVGGEVTFETATFDRGCRVTFAGAGLGEGGSVSFVGARIQGPDVSFAGARFSDEHGTVSFERARLSGRIPFDDAEFWGHVSFDHAFLAGARLSARRAHLRRMARLSFRGASCSGATFLLDDVESEGGCIDLTEAEGAPAIEGAEPGDQRLFSPADAWPTNRSA